MKPFVRAGLLAAALVGGMAAIDYLASVASWLAFVAALSLAGALLFFICATAIRMERTNDTHH